MKVLSMKNQYENNKEIFIDISEFEKARRVNWKCLSIFVQLLHLIDIHNFIFGVNIQFLVFVN